MRLKVGLSPIFCSVLLVIVLLLGACSDKKEFEVTTFSLASPARVDTLDTNTLLVSDYDNQSLLVVDKQSLELSQSISVNGQPTGVAYTDYRGGRYFVGNRSLGSVDIFDSKGAFVDNLGGSTGLFGQVNDLALDEEEELVYVLDSGTAIISVYDFEGNLINPDFTGGTLVRPTAILFGLDGMLYVSDFGPPAMVWIFDDIGNLVGSISGAAVGFSMPQGVYVDADGNVFLVEVRTGEVRVLDASHNFIKAIGTRGTDVGELFYPLDVYVDAVSKDVFITDNQNGRITVYRGEGTVP